MEPVAFGNIFYYQFISASVVACVAANTSELCVSLISYVEFRSVYKPYNGNVVYQNMVIPNIYGKTVLGKGVRYFQTTEFS